MEWNKIWMEEKNIIKKIEITAEANTAAVISVKTKLRRLLFREEFIPPGGVYSSLRITPHPIFSPESPAGWVVKSSLWEWMMTDFPMISSMVKRLS